jgi:hypothetical protein
MRLTSKLLTAANPIPYSLARNLRSYLGLGYVVNTRGLMCEVSYEYGGSVRFYYTEDADDNRVIEMNVNLWADNRPEISEVIDDWVIANSFQPYPDLDSHYIRRLQ